jgi:predicted nucleic acid-binding protein
VWIALALTRDPLHANARDQWEILLSAGAKLHTSVPVVIEAFTFLERNAHRNVAIVWRDSIYKPGTVKIFRASYEILSRPGNTSDASIYTSCQPSTRQALPS